MMSIALIVASLFASKLRWAAIMPACIGLALAADPERFDIFVDRTLAGAAIRGADGRLVVVGKPSSFVVEQWLRADGDARSADDASLRSGARCDPGGCVVRHPSGHAIAFAGDIRSLTEDCTIASVVIAQIKAPAACRAALLDRALANASGAISALRRRRACHPLDPQECRVATVEDGSARIARSHANNAGRQSREPDPPGARRRSAGGTRGPARRMSPFAVAWSTIPSRVETGRRACRASPSIFPGRRTVWRVLLVGLLDRALANASGAIAARFDGDALAIRSTRKNAVSQPLKTAPPALRAPTPTTPAASRASPIRPALDVDPPEEPAAPLDE